MQNADTMQQSDLQVASVPEDGAARLWEKGIYSTDYTEKILNYQTQFNEQLEGSE